MAISLPPNYLEIFNDLRYCGFKMITHILFYRLIQMNANLPNKSHLSWLLFQITIINRDIVFLIQRLINGHDDPKYQKTIRKRIFRHLWSADGSERPIAVVRRLSLSELKTFYFEMDDHIYGIGMDINGPAEPFSPLEMLQNPDTSLGLDDIRREYERIVQNAINCIYAENVRLAASGCDATEADLRPVLFVDHIVVLEPFKAKQEPPRNQKRKWREAKASRPNEQFDLPSEAKKRRLICRPMLKQYNINIDCLYAKCS